jgi:methionyl-tRNA formyltransferase
MKKLVFFGTSDFAKIILEKIIEDSFFDLQAVVTTTDKPVGRKKILTPSPVKELISEQMPALQIFQPENLDDKFAEKLKTIEADYFLVCAYGKIIPDRILDIPTLKSINIHPSNLPEWRGPSPLQATLLSGQSETKVTVMLMDAKMDHGPILAQSEIIQIDPTEKFSDFHDRLATISFDVLKKILPDYLENKLTPEEQNHELATFCKMIKKENGLIDWSKPAKEIYNMWRAYFEWPQIFANMNINGKDLVLKFLNISLTENSKTDKRPGEFFIENKKLFIACGDQNLLEIKKIQPQGKKEMDALSFINGYLK